MPKRRAEDALHDGPRKRDHRPLCGGGDMQLESVGASGCVGPPSLLALPGGRCRERTCYFDDPEGPQASPTGRKAADGDPRNRASNGVSTTQHSGSFHDRRASATCPSFKKRQREESVVPPHAFSQVGDGVQSFSNSRQVPFVSVAIAAPVNCDNENEDCIYNSFQFWRPPLPELDLSLLEDVNNQPEPKEKPKLKDSSSDLMET
ncbi:uncharacterized protein LOC130118536 [Lampris incognitus]|uniref:uncharacterized protein LOC130118536 n=1 Tax=Lampris incognitus TaxID=2546036 RepID=UPI0024B60B23|nr:uncharacterized protein LOC130118536 [Lampris incognitus]